MFSCCCPPALHELDHGCGSEKVPQTEYATSGQRRHPNYAERRRSSERFTVPHVSYHKIRSHLPSLWILTD